MYVEQNSHWLYIQYIVGYRKVCKIKKNAVSVNIVSQLDTQGHHLFPVT